ncbi:DUF2971 domain-containing protein [Clostridium saccharoperbutylacetonicum]|uniref:DUF2971 domain-containing protein n=1 Tax=Clostridium saccharoperbutylacetonicum TaxID=36745 RepID=UPI00098404A6|nr:DUF2971 domain-containing protein [Clostridium saccharoperbutylacetonicum]AQR95543.1 hypothetical protein CLSAP_28590 [Clostridium saccharoperbutylacetonicum]NSB31403.1 hypothetical protein [Clostridium saccharoperbutylacetonicum]
MDSNLKEEYIKGILALDVEKTEEDKLRFKTEVIYKKYKPKELFKYYSCVDYAIEALKNDTICFSRPKDFNDPYDCAISIGVKETIEMLAGSSRLKEIANENQKKIIDLVGEEEFNRGMNLLLGTKDDKVELFESLLEYVSKNKETNIEIKKKKQELIDKIGVLCVGERKDKILMWSYYGCNHTGFCVEYDFGELEKENGPIFPVLYKNDLENINKFIADDKTQGIIVPLITKCNEWEYEQEWRMFINDMDPCETRRIVVGPTPKKLYMGCKISTKYEDEIREICKNKGIELYKMKMKEDAFELIPELINM